MISLSNIQFGYSKKRVLFRELSLDLKAGHIYGLLGKNGSGKTTLLKIMSGLCFPHHGQPTILGHNAIWRSPEGLSKIFFLSEEIFIPHLKINDYVRALSPFYPDFSREQFDQYLKEFEFDQVKDYLDKLSYGQKKKVVISFALSTNAKILLMDEPTNGLDIPSKSIFRRVLASAATEEQLMVISTHQVRDLHSLIDAIILLDNGSILINESAERITQLLKFKHVDESQANREEILYKEETLSGIATVEPNKDNTETKLDLELLFNAAISNKKTIYDIFNNSKIDSHA